MVSKCVEVPQLQQSEIVHQDLQKLQVVTVEVLQLQLHNAQVSVNSLVFCVSIQIIQVKLNLQHAQQDMHRKELRVEVLQLPQSEYAHQDLQQKEIRVEVLQLQTCEIAQQDLDS
jgi:hypothetical protein